MAQATAGAEPVLKPRWGSLDAFRGMALWLMVIQHMADWTGGHVRDRFWGYDDLVITDICAAMFAVAGGASAVLVGRRLGAHLPTPRSVAKVAFRWSQVIVLGLAIDIAVGGGIDGGGVLLTLAALAIGVTVLVVAGVRLPWMWWGIAIGLTVVAGHVVTGRRAPVHGVFPRLWEGAFPLSVYGVFAAGGAALAAHAGSRGESALPLLRAAVAAVVVGTVLAWGAPSLVPQGLWPPARHPGDLAWTVWGLAASLVVWAAIRAFVPPDSRLATGMIRAGRRTLLVYGLHYLIKLWLQHTNRLGVYDTHEWGLLVWVVTLTICAASTIPTTIPKILRRVPSSLTATT
jgi:hypothetical protein